MCSGSSTSAIKASVNAPGNQQHHPSYDNAACAGSVISTACHPPSRFEESLTSTLPSMVGRDQEAAPKPDGRTQSNTTSILLASTPSMPPSWSMTDPSGRPLFADCQRSNPSMALKSSQVSQVSHNLLCGFQKISAPQSCSNNDSTCQTKINTIWKDKNIRIKHNIRIMHAMAITTFM